MESIAITKIMISLQLTPPPPGGGGPPPPGDILNYSTDFHEIWCISSLTIMELITITRI